MTLTQLDLASFRSYRGVRLDLNAPRILVAGLNGTGKTSVKEAIRWVLTGHCEGTDGKGAGAEVLIPMGHKQALVSCGIQGIGNVQRSYAEAGGGAFSVDGFTGTSQIQHQALLNKLKTSPEFLDAVLATDLFLDLGHADAKAMVLSLLGVRIPVGDKSYTLEELDVQFKQAFEDRKVAKRSLQQHVVSPKPAVQQMPTLEAIDAQLSRLRTALGEQQKAIGTSVAARKALHAEADRLMVTINTPVPQDLSLQIVELERRLAELESQAVPATEPPPPSQDPTDLRIYKTKQIDRLKIHLPSQGCVLDRGVPCMTPGTEFSARMDALREELKALAPSPAKASTEPPVSPLTAVRKELADLQWQQQKRTANFEAVKTANHRAGQIREEIAALPSTDAQEVAIAELQARIGKGEQLLKDARTYWDAMGRHAVDSAKQTDLKADVDRLETLVDQLGPKGVRVEALAKAIQTFEAAVNPYVKPFGWTITFDVEPWQVSANGRPVETYSKSERYRIGIALQLGIAQLSGLNFAIIDEVDMLDVANRKAVSEMLMKAPLEQILILGTRETAQTFPALKGVIAYRLAKDKDQTVVSERSAA